MKFLEYDLTTKLVVEIHEIYVEPQEGYGIVECDFYDPGDEFELSIYVNEVNKEGQIVSLSAVQNNPHAKRLLQENKQLKDTIDTLENENAFLVLELATTQSRLEQMEQEQADLLLMLVSEGVI